MTLSSLALMLVSAIMIFKLFLYAFIVSVGARALIVPGQNRIPAKVSIGTARRLQRKPH